MFETFCWLTAIVSLVGVVANIYKQRWAFGLWVVTNSAWLAIDAWYGIFSQASLHGAYLLLAIWGLIVWRTDANKKECDFVGSDRAAATVPS